MQGPQPSSSTPPTLTCHGKTERPRLRSSQECVSGWETRPEIRGAGGQTPVPRFLSEASAPLGAVMRPAPEAGNRKQREPAEQLLLPLDSAACDRRTFAPWSLFWTLIGQQPSLGPINPNHSEIVKISFFFSGRLSTNEVRAPPPGTLGGRSPSTRGHALGVPIGLIEDST